MKKINFYQILFTLVVFTCMGVNQVLAQLPYNTTMTESHYNNSSIVVGSDGASYSQNSWDGGIHLEAKAGWLRGSEWNWDEKFVIIALSQNSIPYKLKFQYKAGSAIASNPDWYVAESESKDGSWVQIWSATTPTNSTVSITTDPLDAEVTLSKSTKYLKLCYKGNYGGTFQNISVSDQAYVNDPKVDDQVINTLDFGEGTISSGKAEKTFDVEWCNVSTLSVSCDNTTYFVVTPASFGATAKYGTQTIKVMYNRNRAVGDHSATITMTNGTVTKTLAVTGKTTLRPQAINWNAELAATNFTLNAEDLLTGEEIATADNEEAEITFSSSNENVIAVSPDGKTIVAVENGTADITVNATGNDIYAAGTDTKTFTVTALKKQTITWDQTLVGLKTNANPNTIALTAEATSGGVITYAIEGGSADCITLGGENNATLTITGTPGEAYIIATQSGGIIGDEEWISATARKQVKVRDPNAACDEYALADESLSFDKGDKTEMVEKVFSLVGKPTTLTFTAKRTSGLKYMWSDQQDMFVEQYANFGSGLEWRLIESFTTSDKGGNYGPYNLDETATKIRFRTAEHASQQVTNISIPRKRELVVSETTITEDAERNVQWKKTVSVSRSNIDVVDIQVSSDNEDCPFAVSKSSIGTDCADRSTETFDIYLTPREKNATYTGTVTITDGKANPTTHTISLSIKAIAFNQTISDFEVPETAWTTDQLTFAATASSGLEVTFSTSDENIARIVNGNELEIITSGEVNIIATQAGDDKWNEVSVEKTLVISKVTPEVTTLPQAAMIEVGETLAEATLTGGEATVEGSFAWADPTIQPNKSGEAYEVIFTPTNDAWFATVTVEVSVSVNRAQAKLITVPTAKQNLVANGEPQELINAGEAEGGTLQYSLNGADYSTDIPTGTEVGEYTVYYRVVGDDLHDDITPATLKVYIADPNDTRIVNEIDWYQTLSVMEVGETLQLEADDWTGNVYFTSSNEAVAYIDEDNVLHAIAEGATTITARADGDADFKPAQPIEQELRVIPASLTAVDEANEQTTVVKLIRNNQILIIRNGRTYTVTGLLQD